MTLAQEIADRVVAMRADNLPKAALDWSQVGVMDTLGCTLAGVAEEAPAKVAELIGVNLNGGPGLSYELAADQRVLGYVFLDNQARWDRALPREPWAIGSGLALGMLMSIAKSRGLMQR